MSRGPCPFAPPQISLDLPDLAAIGRIAMLEARAKASAVAVLKGVAKLSSDEWQASDTNQFAQIMVKLIDEAKSVDARLHGMVMRLEILRKTSQDDRHQIVHANWGHSTEGNPTAFDTRRRRWLTREDIQRAITSNEATDRLAFECVWLTAKLVEEGIIPERAEGAGPAMRLASGLWQW